MLYLGFGAAHLLEMEEPACLMGVFRYHERSRLSACARPMSASVVVTCLTISSSASLHVFHQTLFLSLPI